MPRGKRAVLKKPNIARAGDWMFVEQRLYTCAPATPVIPEVYEEEARAAERSSR